MLIQIEYMGKTYLCSVMSDWVDMIEELGGETGAVSEANKLARLGTPTAPSPSQPRPDPLKIKMGSYVRFMERAGLTHRNNSDIKGARICGDGDTGMNKADSGMMRCI